MESNFHPGATYGTPKEEIHGTSQKEGRKEILADNIREHSN